MAKTKKLTKDTTLKKSAPARRAATHGRTVARTLTTTATRSMATTEARRALPQLVREMGAKAKPSPDLMHDAVDIGPHRKGGAVLLPGVDVAAHAVEVAELRARVEELEEDLEDAGMALFLQERLATTSGPRLTARRFLAGIGMEGHIERLPEH